MKLLCGVDLGGTKLAAGLMASDGKLLDKEVVFDHVGKDEKQVVRRIRDIVATLLQRRGVGVGDLEGIGVGFAGHLRFRDGITITTSNYKGFKIKNFPLRSAIEEHFPTRVVVDNDANAQGMAEYLFGAGAGHGSLVFVTFSTGIGAGIVLDGKLYRGMTGTAGEVGHMIVNPASDFVCGCGNHGCLMAHASGVGLPQVVRRKREQGVKTKLQLSETEWANIDGRAIGEGLKMGDELSRAVVLEFADYAGIGLYNLFQIFNPNVFVIGGGLMSWGPLYIDRIRKKFTELGREMLFDPVEIVSSKLGQDAGVIGAAALLLEQG
ncbi:MAG TPA: ROK family protein [Spirochaetia bacterium]|nr:ROK family protein [Spirochaetia bacterium]